MSSLVTLSGVSLAFGDTEAVRDVSISIEEGDLIVVIGPDGAGKSTLTRLIVGLAQPSSGEVRREVPTCGIGFAGADFDLYVDMTVNENLRFFGGVRGMDEAGLRDGIRRVVELTGLAEAQDRLAGRLSGGMKKKLSLAAALLHEPDVLVLDEPTAGVDPVSRRELWDVVAEANARGAAVIYTSPYLDEATRARRVLAMQDGVLEELDPNRLFSHPGGVKAWIVSSPLPRNRVRSRLARTELGVRAYLREEGLTVLAGSLEEARRLGTEVLGFDGLGEDPVEAPLSVDDVFILMEGRWSA